ncbi:hypothetical protein NM208_g8768 [Fusarium decemcellulare]|uniref:Uncharacterized protein n=1 Tax=Fusarium decemcellulare TaxID=57161 RepID=A0ACC1S464_9HYPO|nr:hypothetical protein NM208_g8768 [Fusarium decemcellulare]
MSTSSGRKRSRNDRDEDPFVSTSNLELLEGVHNEDTPRANKFLLMQPQERRGRESPSLPSSASNRSASLSSRSVSISNRSSPTKQFRNAEMQETGFNVGSFRLDQHPESLKTLRIRLRDIGSGYAILPASLRRELSDSDSEIPPYAFKTDQETQVDGNLPSLSWVQKLVKRAAECLIDREGEASWNADVHAPILEHVFRSDRFRSSGLGDFRCCPSAQILPSFKPRDAPSKMVDFCVFVRPESNSPEEQSINTICQSRPGFSINHTDLGNFCKHPIALSIETKRPGEHRDRATLQMGTWHSSQWRSLRYPLFQPRTAGSIEFLPGIIIQGHDWQFVATILDQNHKALLLTGVRIGGTETELAVYSLIVALQHLREWIKDVYWPAFIEDMLHA